MQLPTLSRTSVRLGKAGQGTAGNLLNQLPLYLYAIAIAERLKLFFLKILCFSHIGWRLQTRVAWKGFQMPAVSHLLCNKC